MFKPQNMRYTKTPIQIQKIKSVANLKKNEDTGSYPQINKVTKLQLADFESQIVGKVVYPWSADYNTDRLDFNNLYPAFPLAIVYVKGITDIRECLSFAQRYDIWTVVRSGGHSLAGFSVCDGLVIDMSGMKDIYINLSDNTAIIDAGATFGDIYPKVEAYHLHLPGGGCPTVAIAGFMQGGGYSLTSRNFGINCDSVLEITAMLADGKIVVANRNRNEDLFWAMRGGTGNNFAVLLTVKYQLYPLGYIYGMQITWNMDTEIDHAALALFTIQENYLSGYSFPNLGIETVLTTDATDKQKKVFFCGAWIGSEEDMQQALSPLLAIPGATITINEKGPYSKINNDLLESCPVLPNDVKAFSQSTYLERSLSVSDWKNILNFFKTAPNEYTMIDMEGYGGNINTVLEDDCAFVHRNVTMDFFCDAFYNKETNDKQKNEEWLAALMQFMKTYDNGHSYQNYPNRNQTDFKWAYWGKYYNTLVAIKNKYDPSNFFHYLQSIGEPIDDAHQSTQIVLFETPSPIQYEAY